VKVQTDEQWSGRGALVRSRQAGGGVIHSEIPTTRLFSNPKSELRWLAEHSPIAIFWGLRLYQLDNPGEGRKREAPTWRKEGA